MPRLAVARFANIRGVIEAPDDYRADLPLVVHTPYGLGEVVFVTVDLDQPPFVQWQARRLRQQALGQASPRQQGSRNGPPAGTRQPA